MSETYVTVRGTHQLPALVVLTGMYLMQRSHAV
jgi:hypothetical protein